MDHVVVVGASLAGIRACETLRNDGHTGAITLVGAERHRPYDRPPLSKKLLLGDWEPERVQLRSNDALNALNLTFKLGVVATALSVANRTITLGLPVVSDQANGDSQAISFDGLIIATGGFPRRLPQQPELGGLHLLRTIDDAIAIRKELQPGTRVVVIGAGFIGLEVAATARQRDCDVEILEGLAAPLLRVVGETIGQVIARVHESHGVRIRCGVDVRRIIGSEVVSGVELSNGIVVPADVVIVGIGVEPATHWLESCELSLHDGVMCDASLNVGVAGIYAAGDVARWPNALFIPDEPTMRIEHWTNAAEQGAHAARNLLATSRGEDAEPYISVPFFWSDQFEARIQFLGRATAEDEMKIVTGNEKSGKLVALYHRSNRLRGVLGISMPKAVMSCRSLLAERATLSDAVAVINSL
jgi:NADPH-dependent 2,4-dienoyl-CoA reductase/sulfur reductase-like enzyme